MNIYVIKIDRFDGRKLDKQYIDTEAFRTKADCDLYLIEEGYKQEGNYYVRKIRDYKFVAEVKELRLN